MSSPQHRRGRTKRPRDDISQINTQNFESMNRPSVYSQPQSYVDSVFSQNPSLQQNQQTGPSTAGTAFSPPQAPSPGALNPPRGKVAIPALKTSHQPNSPQTSKKGRTTHACDFCRKAKAGCTGGQPCVRCKNANVDCVYGDGKRDRERKKLSESIQEANSMTQHNNEILEALRRIRQDTSLSLDSTRTAIDDILSTAVVYSSSRELENVSFGPPSFSPRLRDTSEDQDSENGSTGSVDVVNVDTDRDDTRATGHLGKSSAVAWAMRTAQEAESKTENDSTLGAFETGYALASYHTEDEDVEFVDLTGVSAFDWPEYATADDLVGLYFDHVHNTFPLLDRQSFFAKYETFVRGAGNLSREDSVWLGGLNIVFAIGAVYGQLSKRYGPHYHQQHLIYLKRARMLCLDQPFLFEDARIYDCRVLGLLCLYFISTCRLNRAWTTCGLAIRQALVLGLHIRSHAPGLSGYEKEQRVRLWWSLYTLECQLNELTGRPTCISDQDISTPLPIDMNEDDLSHFDFATESSPSAEHFGRRASKASRVPEPRPTATFQMPIGIVQPVINKFPTLPLPTTSSTHFIYRIQLCILSHEIVTQLYCAATTKSKWTDVQETIRRIDSRLLAWRDTLPPDFNIVFDKWIEPNWNDPTTTQRLGLAMTFNSARMILYRPCLCRFDRKSEQHTAEFNEFNQQSAEKCIHSARTTISLIHWSVTSVERLYSITPWWNTLHCLCEALSVLMLELAFQSHHLPSEAADILDDAKNGVRWLRTMAGESVSARKAWEIFDCLIRLVAPIISWSVYDMPTEAPIPAGYNWRRFQTAGAAFPQQHPQQQEREVGQLNEANLQHLQYDVHQQGIEANAATTAWNQDQNMTFGTSDDPISQFGFVLRGLQSDTVEEQVSNPLTQSTAVEMFGSIGRLHGHYDRPWQHMLAGLPVGVAQQQDETMVGQDTFGGYPGGILPVPTDAAQEQLEDVEAEYPQPGFGF